MLGRAHDMESERTALSRTLLLAVLAGMTYEAVAREHGLTRTAVERRIKTLVLRLIRETGVDGLNESRALFARNLRAQRAAIESALERHRPVVAFERGPEPVVLSDEDIQTALRRVRMRTATPERDVAMVWILLATGLRPLEVARLQIGDYLNGDGTVRLQSQVREGVAVNSRARPLYFSSPAARAAIDAYLLTRGRAGAHAPADGRPYRGLPPDEALFLSQEGRAFQVDAIPTPSGTRHLCQEIHYAYRKIFRRIGVPGLSAINVRHTLMDRLGRRGANESQISELLGVRELRQAKRPRLSLGQLMDGLV